MSFHRSYCSFVPPDVLENLARAGIDVARLSIRQSERDSEKRTQKVIDMAMLLGAEVKEAKGTTAREVL